MTSINEKMGLKPAGKRSMMKLPDDRALRNALTRAKCPACGRTGAKLSKTSTEPRAWCSWGCPGDWPLEVQGAD